MTQSGTQREADARRNWGAILPGSRQQGQEPRQPPVLHGRKNQQGSWLGQLVGHGPVTHSWLLIQQPDVVCYRFFLKMIPYERIVWKNATLFSKDWTHIFKGSSLESTSVCWKSFTLENKYWRFQTRSWCHVVSAIFTSSWNAWQGQQVHSCSLSLLLPRQGTLAGEKLTLCRPVSLDHGL